MSNREILNVDFTQDDKRSSGFLVVKRDSHDGDDVLEFVVSYHLNDSGGLSFDWRIYNSDNKQLGAGDVMRTYDSPNRYATVKHAKYVLLQLSAVFLFGTEEQFNRNVDMLEKWYWPSNPKQFTDSAKPTTLCVTIDGIIENQLTNENDYLYTSHEYYTRLIDAMHRHVF